jgi:transcriptional regulator with XRE-family HTH domain
MAGKCARPEGRDLVTSRRIFGEALRRHREQRSISLDTISQRTKISASLLAALERGDCSRWPPGIYSRAYIRDYAEAIGLERDRVAAEFAECFTETAFPDGAPERVNPTPPPPPAPPARLRLSFADEPHERRRALTHRAAVVVLDLLLTVVAASAVALATEVQFWVALAGIALGWHAVGVVRGSSDTWDLAGRILARRQAPAAEPHATEDPLPEAA